MINRSHAILLLTAAFSVPVLGQNLSFDPQGLNTNEGGSGSFNTSTFFNGTSDQLFTSGANAHFQTNPGTVTVDAPVTAGNLEFNINQPGNEVIGAAGTTNAITFNLAAAYSNPIQIDSINGNLTFNAPLNFVLPSTEYGLFFNNNSAYNITFNNMTFSGFADDYGGDYRLNAYSTGASITLNGAISTTTGGYDNGVSFSGGTNANTLVITANASFNHAFLGVAGAGTILTYTSNLGSDFIGVNGGQLLTGAAGLNITNHIQTNGSPYTVGSDVAGDSTYSGGLSGYNNAVLTVEAGAGAEVHFTGTNGIYSTGGAITKTGAGIVSIETPVNGTTIGALEIQNGTLLLNGSGFTIGGITIDNVTSTSSTQTLAVLGGTGSASSPVTAMGVNSVIAPGNVSATGVHTIGTLTLAGGLTAANGLTMNFTLSGHSNDVLDFGGFSNAIGATPTDTLNLLGVVTINLTGTPTIDSTNNGIFTLMTGLDIGDSNLNDPGLTFVINAPAGYEVVGGLQPGSTGSTGGDYLYVQLQAAAVPEPSIYALMGLGLLGLALLGRFRPAQV